MASLKDPIFNVKKIAPDAYRLSIETETLVVKADLSTFNMMLLVQEIVDEVIEHEADLDKCSICGDDTVADGDVCEILRIKEIIVQSAKRHRHVDRRSR